MIYGTIMPSGIDRRKKITAILEFNNKRKIYLNSKERVEFEYWVISRGGNFVHRDFTKTHESTI